MSRLTLNDPVIITPRLMPGVQIDGAFLSIEYHHRDDEGRMVYLCWLDLPDKGEFKVENLKSGRWGGTLQQGLASLLGFLQAAAESYRHAGMSMTGENCDLFSQPVVEWAYQNSDELGALAYDIEEREGLIIEE